MFIRRLFLYFIGFFFGSILVYFLFFNNQNRSFFPSGIVLDSLDSKKIIIEKKIDCYLSCCKVTEVNLKNLLKKGDVNFSESSPRDTPKKYVVEIETPENLKLKLTFEIGNANAKLIGVKIPSEIKGCGCDG